VADPKSVAALVKSVGERFGGIDVLINNAGIATANHPIDPILATSSSDLASVFATNVIGTISITQALLPLLRSQHGGRRVVVNLSSQLGSIQNCLGGAQGRSGGVACYRISRAANNMAMRTFAGELVAEGFTFLALSPGHVATDMGSAGGRAAPLTVEQSVSGMVSLIAQATPEQSGRFYDFNGTELPW